MPVLPLILFLRLKHRRTGWRRQAHGPTANQKSLLGLHSNNAINYTKIAFVALPLKTAEIRGILKNNLIYTLE